MNNSGDRRIKVSVKMSRPVTRSMTKALNSHPVASVTRLTSSPTTHSPASHSTATRSPLTRSVAEERTNETDNEINEKSKAIHETVNDLPVVNATQFFNYFRELVERAGRTDITIEQVVVIMSFFNRYFHVIKNYNDFSKQQTRRILGSVLIFCRNMMLDIKNVRNTERNPAWMCKLALELTMDAEVKIMRFIE